MEIYVASCCGKVYNSYKIIDDNNNAHIHVAERLFAGPCMSAGHNLYVGSSCDLVNNNFKHCSYHKFVSTAPQLYTGTFIRLCACR